MVQYMVFCYTKPMPIDWAALDGEHLLLQLQQYCVAEGISDIHISPEKALVRLELRRHGMLERLADLSGKQYEDVVRRIKFVAKLKLNLTNAPQDGQYTFSAPDRMVNVRVASIPSRFGETFTLRLLDPERGLRPLVELGFPAEVRSELERIVQIPNGLFLVTGPTGSGKTTTLYAILRTIVGTSRNIISLEDPIEYELAGVVQSQVDPLHDYTFAGGLRSILRHDPDVVLVGEIRDLETAQTAVDAALTGHMVLSTLHTNSAVEAIPRLLSMGVSPYTFAPALRGILAQRLVRTLKDEYQRPGSKFDPSDANVYGGRMCLPELLVVDDTIRDLILLNETADTIEQKAIENGYRTMMSWGGLLINAGLTTRSEIDRVTV
jgi:type II secretory ATPase GspE/PulE/Tfp pilus assembly ATPase PilB-like protein